MMNQVQERPIIINHEVCENSMTSNGIYTETYFEPITKNKIKEFIVDLKKEEIILKIFKEKTGTQYIIQKCNIQKNKELLNIFNKARISFKTFNRTVGNIK